MGEAKTEAFTVSDFIVRRLAEWGTSRIYGYAGDGINGLLGALARAGNQPPFVQVRNEEAAGFMACAQAKFTGSVGVCMATSGPGAIHLLNGLYDARLDHQPVVAIVGQQARSSLGGQYQQELDLQVVMKDVASEFVQTMASAAQAQHLVDRAFRIAIGCRTVTCLIIPHDLQSEPHEDPEPGQHGSIRSGRTFSMPRVVPEQADLARAADVLSSGKRVAILVGAGALGAGAEVSAVAERLGAGVAKALLGKAVLPDDLPFVTGSVGWLGTQASEQMMQSCDTLLMVGSGFPYSEFLPKPGQARGVQIDIDVRMLSLRYPMEVALVGDAGETLRALLPSLRPQADRQWREQIERSIQEHWREVERRAAEPADPLSPESVMQAVSEQLPDNCIITADSGTSAVWLARNLKLRRGMLASLSGTLASMGSALPYALAAKFAYPDRPVLALVGDGAMQMNGINELISVAKHRPAWRHPGFVVLVFNNRDLAFVSWEQRLNDGDPRFAASQDIPDFPYARYAELLGFRGICIDKPESIEAAVREAFACQGPVVIDARVDASVPVFPPHLKPEQLGRLQRALDQGDTDAARIREHLSRPGIARHLPSNGRPG
jgi:pyruvate dehydrogenase (quinone)